MARAKVEGSETIFPLNVRLSIPILFPRDPALDTVITIVFDPVTRGSMSVNRILPDRAEPVACWLS